MSSSSRQSNAAVKPSHCTCLQQQHCSSHSTDDDDDDDDDHDNEVESDRQQQQHQDDNDDDDDDKPVKSQHARTQRTLDISDSHEDVEDDDLSDT